MTRLERHFNDLGYQVVNFTYPSRNHAIPELSCIALSRTLDICNQHNTHQIHFVTHSLGGILVRYFLKHNVIENLGRVVMIAPPNKGSQVVDVLRQMPGFRTVNGPAGAQLGTDAFSIPSHLGKVNYPVGVIAGSRSVNPILSLFLPGPNDGRVTIENAQVEGMTDFISIRASHPFIMSRPETISQAAAFIKNGRFNRRERPFSRFFIR
ncbi:MAG: alpha/beta hydrolase [Chloroflexi bacterium]|nr:alpha/beta hydrolase [Chloroflexota bacterium]